MKQVADDMGVGHTFRMTPVGVYFGTPGVTVPDPYFGGRGPARTGCIECGECMTGCRWNAKNTLPKNYLHLAELAGARILPMTTVVGVDPLPGGGYRIETRPRGRSAIAFAGGSRPNTWCLLQGHTTRSDCSTR